MEKKRRSGETQYLVLDVMMLYLLGDAGKLKHLPEDRIDRLILKGSLYKLIHDYFISPPEQRMTEEELLAKCATTPGSNSSLMHAYYYSGIESIVKGDREQAKKYFNLCLEGRQYLFFVHWLSKAILAHEDEWQCWFDERQTVVSQIVQQRGR